MVDYDPAWPALFEREKSAVWEILGANCVGVRHVGPTSHPGESAPAATIHMVAEVDDLAMVEPVMGGFDFLCYDRELARGQAGRDAISLVKTRGMGGVTEEMFRLLIVPKKES